MNIISYCRERILGSVKLLQTGGVLKPGSELAGMTIAPPRNPAHGDICSNVAMILSRTVNMKPVDLAVRLAELLRKDPLFSRVDVAGAGYINFHFREEVWINVLQAIQQAGVDYGRPGHRAGTKILVDFSAEKQAGIPFIEIFHGIAYCEALANIFEFCGCQADRRYAIPDACTDLTGLCKGNTDHGGGSGLSLAYDTRIFVRNGAGKDKGERNRGDTDGDNENRTSDKYIWLSPVRCTRAGEPVGGLNSLQEYVPLTGSEGEYAVDSLRFMLLLKKNDAVSEPDLAETGDKSWDNPFFCVQYAQARIFSVIRNAQEKYPLKSLFDEDIKHENIQRIETEREKNLVKTLALFPGVIEGSYGAFEPHRVAFYLYSLARDFHAIWAPGKEAPQLASINEHERESTAARRMLLESVARVSSNGLRLLGIKPVREML